MITSNSSLKGGSTMRSIPSRALSARYPRAFRRATRHYYDGYSDFGGASIYSGTRAPWTEQDPYPDYVLEQGPRGGISLA